MGGASAATNTGVSDRLFKRQGRWKTDQAKDGYIEDKLDSLLSVSRSLHIWFAILFLCFRMQASINEMQAPILSLCD